MLDKSILYRTIGSHYKLYHEMHTYSRIHSMQSDNFLASCYVAFSYSSYFLIRTFGSISALQSSLFKVKLVTIQV